MDFNIKGITFTKADLVELELENIKVGSLSRHHLFHFFGNDKAILVLRAGDYIESSFVTDYLDRGMLNVLGLEVVREEELIRLQTFFTSYQAAKTERDLLNFRKEFFELFKEMYSNSSERSFLVFVIFFFDQMYAFTDQILNTFQQTSTILFARALRISTLGVISSLLNNYLDWKYLRDFYNTCFMLDYGLVEYGQFHYALALACEAERIVPGSGVKKLEKMKRTEGEIQLFLNHPTISLDFAKEHGQKLSHPNLLNIIKLHHEKSDGSGFPASLRYEGLSEFEVMLTFCDNMVPFSEDIYSFGDLKTVFNENLDHLRSLCEKHQIPAEKLLIKWDGLMNWLSQEISDKETA